MQGVMTVIHQVVGSVAGVTRSEEDDDTRCQTLRVLSWE